MNVTSIIITLLNRVRKNRQDVVDGVRSVAERRIDEREGFRSGK